MNQNPVRAEVLTKALDATMKSRNQSYGDPYPNLRLAADMLALYQAAAGKKYNPAHDAAIAMIVAKIARIATGAVGHEDNYVDGAAYFAIAAECQTVGAVVSQNHSAAGVGLYQMVETTALSEEEIEALSRPSEVVIVDPINANTKLPEEPVKQASTGYKHSPVEGMLFKTQESGVIIWEVLEVYPRDNNGMLWFRSAMHGRPKGSLNPQHFRERMPASAIFEVVAE